MVDLLRIMEILRGENGCPWDKEQTHASIRGNFIEETYEAVEAIDLHDAALLREELGDVLLQVVFHARMEEEQGSFTFGDVLNDLCEKLVIRHPHVFGEKSAANTGEALENWEAVKNVVKGTKTQTERLNAVPRVYPALMRSQKVAGRAAKAGIDAPDFQSAWKNFQAGVVGLETAVAKQDAACVEESFGDLLFRMVNVARKLEIDSEYALTRSCDQFIADFAEVEQLAEEAGLSMKDADSAILMTLWEKAKNIVRSR